MCVRERERERRGKESEQGRLLTDLLMSESYHIVPESSSCKFMSQGAEVKAVRRKVVHVNLAIILSVNKAILLLYTSRHVGDNVIQLFCPL